MVIGRHWILRRAGSLGAETLRASANPLANLRGDPMANLRGDPMADLLD
jgi:hypothetical protein